MTLSELLRGLIKAFPTTPYPQLKLHWHEHLALWMAHIEYWSPEPYFKYLPWGRTPEEATAKYLAAIEGCDLYRTGQNGSWGKYTVEESVTCDDVAFTKPKRSDALPKEGYREVFREEATRLAEKAETVFLRTFIGDRALKGYPEDQMIPEDKEGKGYRQLLESFTKERSDHPIGVGVYDDGKTVGFHGGLL